MSLRKNIEKRGLKDITNPKKWKIFLRSKVLKALKKEYSEMFIPEYLEQISIRMSHPDCRDCLEAGECVHCGCKTPDLFYEKDMECSGGNWTTMEPPEIWVDLREIYEINDDYIRQIKEFGRIIDFEGKSNEEEWQK